MRFMRVLVWLASVLVLAAGCGNDTKVPTETKATPSEITPAQSPLERGKYLVTVGGCNDCHTPKKPGPNGPDFDMTRQLSGNPSTEKLAPVPVGLIAPDKYL